MNGWDTFSKFFLIILCFPPYFCLFLFHCWNHPYHHKIWIYTDFLPVHIFKRGFENADLKVLCIWVLLKIWSLASPGNLLKGQILWLCPILSESATLKMGWGQEMFLQTLQVILMHTKVCKAPRRDKDWRPLLLGDWAGSEHAHREIFSGALFTFFCRKSWVSCPESRYLTALVLLMAENRTVTQWSVVWFDNKLNKVTLRSLERLKFLNKEPLFQFSKRTDCLGQEFSFLYLLS